MANWKTKDSAPNDASNSAPNNDSNSAPNDASNSSANNASNCTSYDASNSARVKHDDVCSDERLSEHFVLVFCVTSVKAEGVNRTV
jgi:hypothetical protein